MAAGQSHTCARKRDGSLYCWGGMNTGALASGDLAPRTDDLVWCIGSNAEHELAADPSIARSYLMMRAL